MKFYDREQETAKLQEIQQKSLLQAQMTIITGRRRIGKTQLLLNVTAGQPTLYFFVARKAEADLVVDFLTIATRNLGIPFFGQVTSFAELFRFLAPIDVPFGIHAFDRHGNSEVFQYFGKEIVQVLGFHQRDGFFVYRADVGQHVAGFQPGKIDFVIKYLAAPVSFVISRGLHLVRKGAIPAWFLMEGLRGLPFAARRETARQGGFGICCKRRQECLRSHPASARG